MPVFRLTDEEVNSALYGPPAEMGELIRPPEQLAH